MTDSATAASTVEYKVVLSVPASKMIFAIPDGNAFRLPRVLIPRWTRPAEEITRELRANWNLNTVILNLLPNVDSQPACAVAEVMDTQSAEDEHALCLSSIEEIDKTELDEDEQDNVCTVLSGNATCAGPFSRPGWLREAQDWIQESLPGRRIDFADEFRQYNAGDTFALIRFATRSGPKYWLKATGEPNKHEFPITVALSELFPQYLPPLVAKREDWNAWVTEDAGNSLGDCQSLTILTLAVEALAELQIQSLCHVSRLEETGCFDLRLTNVQARLTEVMAYVEEAMGHQTSTKVPRLQPLRLREISSVIEGACLRMQDLNIPSSLVNNDVNLDNILDNGSRRSFIDWAEAGIGNPFLTLQQVVQHVIRDGAHLDWVSDLREAYKRKWLPVLTETQIDRAFSLMPLLTMISYLYGRGDWLNSPRCDEPAFQSFARTIARNMDRAASEPTLMETLQRPV